MGLIPLLLLEKLMSENEILDRLEKLILHKVHTTIPCTRFDIVDYISRNISLTAITPEDFERVIRKLAKYGDIMCITFIRPDGLIGYSFYPKGTRIAAIEGAQASEDAAG